MPFADKPVWIDGPAYSGAVMRRVEAISLAANGAAGGVAGGVRPGDPGLLVSLAGMSISAAAGVAALGYVGQGLYRAYNGSTWTGTVSTAHASLQRLDLVYLRVWDNSVDAAGLTQADVVYLAGTAGSGVLPTPPGTVIWIPLAQITVPAGSTTPSATDLRPMAVAPGGIAPVASAALATAGLYAGQTRYNLVKGYIETWTGTAWVSPGDWTTYVCVWSTASNPQPVKGSATLFARYNLVGHMCTAKLELSTASDTSYGNGLMAFSVPFAAGAAGTANSIGAGHGITPGARWDLQALITSGQSVMNVLTPAASGDCRLQFLASGQGIGGVTWATTHVMRAQVTYEIA